MPISSAILSGLQGAINTNGMGPEFTDPGRKDPYKNFKFLVIIDGFVSAGFKSAAGISMETDAIEYREGGEITTLHKVPGMTKFDDVTLERGMSMSQDMWQWAAQVFNTRGEVYPDPAFRRNMSIMVLDRVNNLAKQWQFYDAWVKSYSGGDLDAVGAEVLMERIVIAHEGFDLVQG